jgi:superfamily II DNA helicase RecQ
MCLGRPSLPLKSEQIEAVRHMYNGKDVLLWLPTGFGKSVCYEILPFIMDYRPGRCGSGQRSYSTVLVVSPLISLMVDQVTSLRQRGNSRHS